MSRIWDFEVDNEWVNGWKVTWSEGEAHNMVISGLYPSSHTSSLPPSAREGGVWRVIIPVLQVKGKNSCVQLFLPFFWRANLEFYRQKKRTQSVAFNIHYLQLSDHNYGGAAATGHKWRLKRGWPWVYALDIEWSLMNKLSYGGEFGRNGIHFWPPGDLEWPLMNPYDLKIENLKKIS